MLIFYPAVSLNLLALIVFFVCVCVCVCIFFIFHIWSCHLQRGIVLLVSFQFGCLLFPFSWHTAQVITFRTMFLIQFWIEAVKAGIVVVVPDLRRNSFSLSLLMLVVGLVCLFVSINALNQIEEVLFIPSLFNVFIMEKCWILWNSFSASIEDYIFFHSINMIYYNWLLLICGTPCEINITWSWCVIILTFCWIQFARILFRIFCIYIHRGYWSVVFLSCDVSGFGIT